MRKGTRNASTPKKLEQELDKKVSIFKIQFYDHHFSDHRSIPSCSSFPTHTCTKNREGYRDTMVEEDETNHAMASVSSERTKPLSSMQPKRRPKRKRIFGHANGDEEEKLVGKRERRQRWKE